MRNHHALFIYIQHLVTGGAYSRILASKYSRVLITKPLHFQDTSEQDEFSPKPQTFNPVESFTFEHCISPGD